jgi:hypothetical protein
MGEGLDAQLWAGLKRPLDGSYSPYLNFNLNPNRNLSPPPL